MLLNRRNFIGATGAAFSGLLLNGCTGRSAPLTSAPSSFADYGPLVPDPAGMLDLPRGFSYRLLSSLGNAMTDGCTVPDKADGMGCFSLGNDEIVLIRNHELVPADDAGGVLAKGFGTRDGAIVPGGTTSIVLDATTLEVKREFRSLAGTIRNCSGGITPWGSWLTCEEAPTGPGQRFGEGLAENHGWVFEVPADATGLIDAVPLKAMGRFNHEAACVDPRTGIVYLSEDRDDSVLYRFVPTTPGRLGDGGLLQAMVVEGLSDTRNWTSAEMAVGSRHTVRWIDCDDVESPNDDLRSRAAAKGAAVVARGEGIHTGTDEIFVCSTNGGQRKLGQILRLVPGTGGEPDQIELFFESQSKDQFNYGDNLTVGPNGHLIVCEDQYTEVVDNHLRGITPDGRAYTLGRLRMQTELAGGCFSPDGKWFFVNAYSPTRTLAITGPWAA
ncbi:phosphatase [Erythrobacter sp. SAORIC-644]|uniref:alkaline phosphatase PhoX n=1 Tax=Erythrobacter sp. SAORIC-644 TaxID=1869314 RepID=UPI000C9F5787|nr:alkaline phosphatase PhoX [Erythrobacter sp. SAORIC-644]PNQ75687.1 phosphatase [Erythrobacter sp. SAORIC-644]